MKSQIRLPMGGIAEPFGDAGEYSPPSHKDTKAARIYFLTGFSRKRWRKPHST
jgi:hypothetical protein